jgi:hypothetical protein
MLPEDETCQCVTLSDSWELFGIGARNGLEKGVGTYGRVEETSTNSEENPSIHCKRLIIVR